MDKTRSVESEVEHMLRPHGVRCMSLWSAWHGLTDGVDLQENFAGNGGSLENAAFLTAGSWPLQCEVFPVSDRR